MERMYNNQVTTLPISTMAKNILANKGIRTIKKFMSTSQQEINDIKFIESEVRDELINMHKVLLQGVQFKKSVIQNRATTDEYRRKWIDESISSLALSKSSIQALEGVGVTHFSQLFSYTESDLIKFKNIDKIEATRIIEFRTIHWEKMIPIDFDDDICEQFFITDVYDNVIYAVCHVLRLNKKRLVRSVDNPYSDFPNTAYNLAGNKGFLDYIDFYRSFIRSEYVFESLVKAILVHIAKSDVPMSKEEIMQFMPAIFRNEGVIYVILSYSIAVGLLIEDQQGCYTLNSKNCYRCSKS